MKTSNIGISRYLLLKSYLYYIIEKIQKNTKEIKTKVKKESKERK